MTKIFNKTNDAINSKSNKKVKLKFSPENKTIFISEWSQSGCPVEKSCLKFELKTEEYEKNSNNGNKKSKLERFNLHVSDSKSKINYSGTLQIPNSVRYFVGVQEGDEINLHPCHYFKMKPVINYEKKTSTFSSHMNRFDLIDELTNKFGSKVSHRVLDQRKKNELCLKGTGDAETDLNAMELDKNENNLIVGKDSQDKNSFEDILPTQRKNCVSPKEVYNIEDIINPKVATLIKNFSENKQSSEVLNSDYLKELMKKKWNDINEKIIAIYLDILSRLYHLKAYNLKNLSPIPNLDEEDIQAAFLDTYTQCSKSNYKVRRVVSERFKDKIIIHAIILMITLNDFKPLEINQLSELLKVSFTRLKKLIEVVGCYIESVKNPDRTIKKTFVLKLPLNTIKESKFNRKSKK